LSRPDGTPIGPTGEGSSIRPPFDRRLLREARAARPAIAGAVVVGTAMTVAVLVQAIALATVIGRIFAASTRHAPAHLATPVVVLVVAVGARALLAMVGEIVSELGATSVRSEIRGRLLSRVVSGGPAPSASKRDSASSGELIVLATRGVEALEQYFSGYLPQLVVAVVAPVVILAWMLGVDRWSALILVGTLTVVPVFMVLLGQEAAARMRRQWSELERLGGHFADVMHGLTTLKLFDRLAHQVQAIEATTDRLRRATLHTLRYAFLSSFVFELLASLATALVAIVLGLRLLSGQVHLTTALAVLFMAPEVFLPLRKASARFHAAADGIGASDALLAVLRDDEPASPPEPASRLLLPSRPFPLRQPCGVTRPAIQLADDRRRPAGAGPCMPLVELRSAVFSRQESSFVLGPLGACIHRGERWALLGPTGSGKSTLLLALLGYLMPDSGQLLLGGAPVSSSDLAAWRRRVSWMPQAPAIISASVLANVTMTSLTADAAAASVALDHSGARALVASLGGLQVPLREAGHGLSSGERQRIALARALCRRAELYLLDEPTAHLDRRYEAEVTDGIFAATSTAALVVVTHSTSLADRCDAVIDLSRSSVEHDSAGINGALSPDILAKAFSHA
jgi:ATP-binding cassette subfamily C protein CydCD